MNPTLFDLEDLHGPELPALRGSPRQIEHFGRVRDGKIRHCRTLVRNQQEYIERHLRHVLPRRASSQRQVLRKWIERLETLEQETDINWWIERRDNDAAELLSDAPPRPGPDPNFAPVEETAWQ